MDSLSNEEFIDFLESFKSDEKYYETVSEISRPKNEDGTPDMSRNPLITNDFQMLSLDDMCQNSDIFDDDNTPSTTDALWYKLNEDGDIILYFIEFKGSNLTHKDKYTFKKLKSKIKGLKNCASEYESDIAEENFQKANSIIANIWDYHKNDVEFSLRLKPFESLFIVVPLLYEEYCDKNNIENYKDIRSFLTNCEKKLFLFAGTYHEQNNNRYTRNKSRDKLKYNRFHSKEGTVGYGVKLQYERMYKAKIFSNFVMCFNDPFDKFLKIEGFTN